MELSKAFLAASAAALGLSIAACDNPGPAEKVGQQIDRSVEKAGQQLADAKQAGESVVVQAGQGLDDASLTARVKAALLGTPGVGAMKIDVETRNGVVALFGTVDDATERKQALQAARSVDGVRSVDDRLVVVKGS